MPHLHAGQIVLWFGAIGAIPAGFTLCDGTLGTPDLRDRFIVGSGTTYNPGDVGGSINHNHTFTGDGHSHSMVPGIYAAAGASFQAVTSTDPAIGTTDNENGLPPYHSLAYIMRI